MSETPKFIEYKNSALELHDGETVLSCLERNGHEVPSSCRQGLCGNCLMQCTAGTPTQESQPNFSPQWKQLGYFLPCVCKSNANLSVSNISDVSGRLEALILSKGMLSSTVMRIRITRPKEFSFEAGQFIRVQGANNISRAYSIASTNRDDYLELHIQKVRGGEVSTWLHESCEVGAKLSVQGPFGECFYSSEYAESPILLAARGTGLSPLMGVLKDALHAGHQNKLVLCHSVRHREELYQDPELRLLSSEWPQLQYVPLVDNGSAPPAGSKLSLLEYVQGTYSTLQGWVVYTAGSPETVKHIKKCCFLAGAKLDQIHSDAFVPQSDQNLELTT